MQHVVGFVNHHSGLRELSESVWVLVQKGLGFITGGIKGLGCSV